MLLSLSLIFSTTEVAAKEHESNPDLCKSKSMVQLKGDLRKLWIDHTIWTRNYIVSAIAELEDTDEVLARLLKNQEDIGNAIKPFYGEDAGNKLADLLTDHILIAGKIVEAAKSDNQAELKNYNSDWYRNADDIAHFLSNANPNWSNKQLTDLLYMHLKLVTEDVVARLKKDWEADIIAFDKGEAHIIEIADVLTDGIIKQFPNQF
ncbi:hypothetical protein [Rossellomorea aquimaris]|uniref:hypothetical protein n=1 Tax=Rossellomorea aquimaris TaxID=189382 RepID=UPI0007D05E1E|nr:hypothetical protein [Rossellomorea aquimaris]